MTTKRSARGVKRTSLREPLPAQLADGFVAEAQLHGLGDDEPRRLGRFLGCGGVELDGDVLEHGLDAFAVHRALRGADPRTSERRSTPWPLRDSVTRGSRPRMAIAAAAGRRRSRESSSASSSSAPGRCTSTGSISIAGGLGSASASTRVRNERRPASSAARPVAARSTRSTRSGRTRKRSPVDHDRDRARQIRLADDDARKGLVDVVGVASCHGRDGRAGDDEDHGRDGEPDASEHAVS